MRSSRTNSTGSTNSSASQDLRDGVERTPTQRRAAALVEMATRSATMPAGGQRPKPLFTMTMGVGHFAWTVPHRGRHDHRTRACRCRTCPHAEIERIVYDPPNRKLEASHRTRFTGALRKIIGLRDRHCQHPSGCDEPAIEMRRRPHRTPLLRRHHLHLQRPTVVHVTTTASSKPNTTGNSPSNTSRP